MKMIKILALGLMFVTSVSQACDLPQKKYQFSILMNNQIIQKELCGNIEKEKVGFLLDKLNDFLVENNLTSNYKIIAIQENDKLVTIN